MGWLYGAIECYEAVRIGNDINHPGVRSKGALCQYHLWQNNGIDREVLEGSDYKGMIRFARSVAQNYYIHNHIAICDPIPSLPRPITHSKRHDVTSPCRH